MISFNSPTIPSIQVSVFLLGIFVGLIILGLKKNNIKLLISALIFAIIMVSIALGFVLNLLAWAYTLYSNPYSDPFAGLEKNGFSSFGASVTITNNDHQIVQSVSTLRKDNQNYNDCKLQWAIEDTSTWYKTSEEYTLNKVTCANTSQPVYLAPVK